MKRIFILLSCLVMPIAFIYAVKAFPGLIQKKQSDGSVISYYIHGDENFNYITSEDGYMLLENSYGIFEYARLGTDMRLKSTGLKARNICKRSKKESIFLMNLDKAENIINTVPFKNIKNIQRIKTGEIQKISGGYPLSGSPKSLVILVNFSDKAFTSETAKQDYHRLLNEPGYSDNGGTGCAVDYFKASSNGVFSPNFIVEGPYTLPHEMSWYGGNNDYGDQRAGNMIVDACDAAAAAGVNFKEYDTNNDGNIDNVFVYYAGYNEAEGGGANTVWPHRSIILGSYKYNGVALYDYACTSEFRGSVSNGGMCGIGTFCHEFGHVLGLPDFYSTDPRTTHPTLEKWDIMDGGSYNNLGRTPPAYSSYERFFLGWLTPTQLNSLDEGTKELAPLIESNKAYIVSLEDHNLNGANPDPKEFFLLENRQKIGADSFVPGTGLLVTHVCFNQKKWNENGPNNDPDNMGVSIYCAKGTTNIPEMNTFPGVRNVTSCSFKMKDNTLINVSLTKIKEVDNDIFFNVGASPEISMTLPKEPFDVVGLGKELIQTIDFTANRIKKDTLKVSVKSNTPFKIRKHNDKDTAFVSSLSFVGDSLFNVVDTLDVKFSLYDYSYDDFKNGYIEFKYGTFSDVKTISWRAKRPIYITKPVVCSISDYSPYAFTMHWNRVYDATEYYASVYSISAGTDYESESFEDFKTRVPIGWKSSFNRASSDDNNNVLFKLSSDTLYTKQYIYPVSKFNFDLKSINGSEGVLFIDGLKNNQWLRLDSLEISKYFIKVSKSFSLSDKSIDNFRFIYKPKVDNGGVSLYDFSAQFDKTIQYIVKDSIITDTLMRVIGLIPGTEYIVRAKSSDRDTLSIKPRYNNFSDYSEVYNVMTLDGPKKERELAVVKNVGGTYTIFVPDFQEAYSVFVYSLDGHLVKVINSDSDTFEVSGLVNGNIYILKYAERGKMRRKTKVTKLYYNVRN